MYTTILCINPLRLAGGFAGDNTAIPGSNLFWRLKKSVANLDVISWNISVNLLRGGVATYMYQEKVMQKISKTIIGFNNASFLPLIRMAIKTKIMENAKRNAKE
jgi:hypothetical protein